MDYQNQPRSILIFRALQLGDMLCSVPALRALRRAFPWTRITLCGLPWAKFFCQRFSAYIDDFLEFPGASGLPEQPCSRKRLNDFFRSARSRRFQLGLQMHGNGIITNGLMSEIAAQTTAGFYPQGGFCPDPQRFIPYPEELPEPVRLLRLLDFLNIPRQGNELEFPVSEEEEAEGESLICQNRIPEGSFICVHPGARSPNRRWSVEGFAAVVRHFCRTGHKVLITGSREEKDLCGMVRELAGDGIDLSGRTSLGCLAALLRKSRLLVSNDTGVAHMAVGLKIPSVVIYCASSPQRWAADDRRLHRPVFYPVACRTCEDESCENSFECKSRIPPERVIAACDGLPAPDRPEGALCL